MRILAIILVLAASCQATTYFVAKTGSDANPGSVSQPWLTIGHAAGVATSGDTVLVENGTYNETIVPGHSGVIFQSQNKWGATIQCTSGVTNCVNLAAGTITIKNFEIIGAADGSTPTGIKCNTGDGCLILGNEIHHIGTTSSSCPLGAAIEPNNGNSQSVIGNIIYDVSPPRTAARCNHEQGIYSSTGTSSNANGIIQNNVILACYQCYAIQFDGGFPSGWTVTNNTIANVGQGSPNNAGGGIYFNCAGAGHTCDNNKFNNNIFYNVGGDSCITEATVAPGGTNGTHNVYQNNLFFNCFGGNNFINGSLSGSVNANPQFVNYTGDQSGDYHLSTTGAHTITARASDNTTGSSVLTVSTSAPLVGFDLKANTVKNGWELKEGSRVLFENSYIENCWGSQGNGGGQQCPMLLMQALNQANQTTDGNGVTVGYGPEHINDITIRNIKGIHFGAGIVAVPLGNSLGIHRVSISQILADDVNYENWGNGFEKIMTSTQEGGTASTNVPSWTNGSNPLADHINLTHSSIIGNVTNPFAMVNNLAQFKLISLTWQDSFIASPGSSTFVNANGEANDCNTASGSSSNNTEANALVQCISPYTFDHLNLTDSTANPTVFLSAPIWQLSNSSVGFVNYNSGSGGDYRLCTGVNLPSSPCAGASIFAAGQTNQASDGTDLGPNITILNAVETAARSGTRTP